MGDLQLLEVGVDGRLGAAVAYRGHRLVGERKKDKRGGDESSVSGVKSVINMENFTGCKSTAAHMS